MYVVHVVESLILSLVETELLKDDLCHLLRIYRQKEKKGLLLVRVQVPLHLNCEHHHLKTFLLHVNVTQAHPTYHCLNSTERASLIYRNQ